MIYYRWDVYLSKVYICINFMIILWNIFPGTDTSWIDLDRRLRSPEKRRIRDYLPTNFPRNARFISINCFSSSLSLIFFFFKHFSSRMASTTPVAESSFWKRHAQLERSLFLSEQRYDLWSWIAIAISVSVALPLIMYQTSQRQGTLMPLCSPSLYIWHLESAEHACANLTR